MDTDEEFIVGDLVATETESSGILFAVDADDPLLGFHYGVGFPSGRTDWYNSRELRLLARAKYGMPQQERAA